MTTTELRDMTDDDLQKQLEQLRHELFELRFKHATSQLEKTHRLPEVKQTIARILTVLGERERAQA